MAPTIGKRKRITREELEQSSRASSPSSTSQHSDGEDMQALFRKAFEAKFAPLNIEPVQKAQKMEAPADDLDEESDWSGISSEDENETSNGIQVFDHSSAHQPRTKAPKTELRAFMSAKPPSLSVSTAAKPAPKPKKEDDSVEAAHMKNDLELQKLLRESHILSSNAPTYSTRTGNTRETNDARHKLTDLHIQSLGAKKSIFAQKSMPMSHRKGINAKTKMRDNKRRAEAKENGITLEKEQKVRKAVGKRDRGVGAPSVGKFKGGTLTLSKKELRGLTSSAGDKSKGKKGRRR
ncbi:pre-rRNA processing and 40S ribosomal subunit assembly [Didymosphaeria variabile]|uniref:Pre-rRNA processing and 40S ribosomal subunit assembly n=1 Tax=Didymosphaeria variabile TaxID=1932322 RepID=A0A9W9CAI0_9PLEO|nr:pre-rRNA processing and 40S ribosomal subunit assembly [Didymosphaeria variabile]KAJ4353736.1 pre-rRNA processing and 40S ribosomal subunit assembly [Didymosphaeria variabile]